MPQEGLNWLSRKELMTYEEMFQTCSLLVGMGIEKIRITGGEPFVRKDIMQFMTALSKLDGLNELTLTTNGVLTAPHVPELKKIGVKSVNLSLDTLDAGRFFTITRRDEFSNVMETLEELLKHDIEVKINAVVMDGQNTQDIIPLAALTKELPVSVRFIEEMPFNGDGHVYSGIQWNHVRILDEIKNKYPSIQKLPDPPNSTAYNYQIPGHQGSVGVIAAYSRTFCGTCNRIRITPTGELKTCLYAGGGLNIKDLIRQGTDDEQLKHILINAFQRKAKNGWEAEKARVEGVGVYESMASIGG
jgi:cyclic pyranopterin phosphate synthase